MSVVSEMFDQLRLLANDPTDSTYPFTTKKAYLNNGIRAMYPRLYRVTRDETLTVASTTVYSYTLPTAVRSGAIISFELENLTDNEFYPLYRYEVSPGDEDTPAKIHLTDRPHPGAVGANLRVTVAMPFDLIAAGSYAAAQAETWPGPDDLLHLPVYYAMGVITAGKLEERTDWKTYSTLDSPVVANEQDIISISNIWFDRFELETEQKSQLQPRPRLRVMGAL